MFPDIRIVWLVRREQNRDLVREAERERLRLVANSARSRLLARVVARIGGFLRKVGTGLGYPCPEALTGKDPRSDQRILQSLEAEGKRK